MTKPQLTEEKKAEVKRRIAALRALADKHEYPMIFLMTWIIALQDKLRHLADAVPGEIK